LHVLPYLPMPEARALVRRVLGHASKPDLNLRTASGVSVLELAVSERAIDVVELLLARGASVSSHCVAVARENTDDDIVALLEMAPREAGGGVASVAVAPPSSLRDHYGTVPPPRKPSAASIATVAALDDAVNAVMRGHYDMVPGATAIDRESRGPERMQPSTPAAAEQVNRRGTTGGYVEFSGFVERALRQPLVGSDNSASDGGGSIGSSALAITAVHSLSGTDDGSGDGVFGAFAAENSTTARRVHNFDDIDGPTAASTAGVRRRGTGSDAFEVPGPPSDDESAPVSSALPPLPGRYDLAATDFGPIVDDDALEQLAALSAIVGIED
jgi:hypothetical protein